VHKFQEHKEVLTNTVAEALGTLFCHAVWQDLWCGEYVRPHYLDD
jgi:hypothetical protein